MNRTSIDGWAATYVAAGEEIPADEAAGVRGYDFRKDRAVFDHDRARRLILDVPMKSGAYRFFGVVHWSDGSDLEDLDRRSRTADDLSERLSTGLFCTLNDVQCLVCANNHLVAVADGGYPIVTLARQRAHEFSSTCPTCGNESYIRHAEHFVDA